MASIQLILRRFCGRMILMKMFVVFQIGTLSFESCQKKNIAKLIDVCYFDLRSSDFFSIKCTFRVSMNFVYATVILGLFTNPLVMHATICLCLDGTASDRWRQSYSSNFENTNQLDNNFSIFFPSDSFGDFF